jgi:hypothetical protein
MARVFIALRSGTTWIAPPDCKEITVECLSGGAYFDQSNPLNGSYSKSNKISVTQSQKFYYAVSSGSSASWFNTINAVPVVGTQNSANSCMAWSSSIATQSTQLSNSIGDYIYYGGAAYLLFVYNPCAADYYYYAGSGAAAGPDGNGGSNYLKNGSSSYYYGGGANGGTSANPTSAGTGPLGNIDGTNGAPPLIAGLPITNSQYVVWNDGFNVYGIASGFSGDIYELGINPDSSKMSLFGYGGITQQGLIVVSYVPAGSNPNSYTEVYLGPTLFNWRVPAGVTSIKVEAIGKGATGNSIVFGAFGAGGGGAYASNTISVNSGQFFTANISQNTVFSNTTTIFVNAGGAINNIGGSVLVGTGYPGGNGAPMYGTTIVNAHGGGGGGAGGPNGPGGAGGLPAGANNSTSGGGGGGGGAGLVGSPVTLSPTSLAANGSLYFTIPSGKTIIPGTTITVSGTFGSGGLTGYTNPTDYYVRATNGSTTATFCTTFAATVIAATATTNFGSAVFTISNRGGVGGLTGSGSNANYGGAGGSGAFRDPGGAGGTVSANATSVIGGGGGGGGAVNATYKSPAVGNNATIYSASQSNTAIGFFIGGGGGGGPGSSTIGWYGADGGFGAGGGAGGSGYGGGAGGQGLIAITYTVSANNNASESSMMSMF